MSPLSRVGPLAMRSIYFHQQRGMAAAAMGNIDPVQRLFVEKINEFKTTNRGLDEQYKKKELDELTRLKKVFQVENEAKLAQIESNFPKTANISLGDIDDNKEKIQAIMSGEYYKQKQLKLEAKALENKKPKAEVHHSPYHLPPLNREPYPELLPRLGKAPEAAHLAEPTSLLESGLEKLDPKELEKAVNVRFGPSMPTIDDDKSPERDVVNFPRQPQLMDVPPRVFHVLPKSWFDFFHSKTGYSGGFTFATTFGLFLVSKEWIVMEHEICTGLSLTIIISIVVSKAGPAVNKYLDNLINNGLKGWDDWQKNNIQLLDDVVDHYKAQENVVNNLPLIYDARREDVQVQLESEYRRRLKAVHDSTKKKLNYLVAVADSKRNIAHEHMVNWVIDHAVNSIGPKQEADVLDNCISNLKSLAAKNANVI